MEYQLQTNESPKVSPRRERPMIVKPLKLTQSDNVEPYRIVLYREDFRQLAIGKGRSKYFNIEISRSKHKLYIIALKCREFGKPPRGLSEFVIEMTEK